MTKNIQTAIRAILSDIRVDLAEEFDLNFERQGFFAEKWQRRRSPLRGDKTILVDSGALRRSIRSRSDENSITFYSDLPYAAIHNEGGEIRVTEKMKRYFWYRYYSATVAFGRKKDGSLRKDRRNERLNTEAEFYRHMALMKVGKTVKIPRRRFLGYAPEVEKTVREIIENNLNIYFDKEFDNEKGTV